MSGSDIRQAAATALLLVLVLGPTGCGPDGPKMFAVRGKVTLKDGSPVKYGLLILHPDKARGNNSIEQSHGTIRDGTYTVLTGTREGAPPGFYRVSIEAAAEVDEKNPYFTKWYADEVYVNPNTSKLTMEVVERPEPGQYDFKLEPHAPHAEPPDPKGKKKK